MMWEAACPGYRYSVSTAVIPYGWRVIRGFINAADLGQHTIVRLQFYQGMHTSRRPIAVLRAAALCVATLALPGALLAQSQPGPSHQERGSLIFEGIPAPDSSLAMRLERYQQSRGATFLDWLPDGGMLVATRFGNAEQVHRVAAPLGDREQLTFFPDPISGARAAQTGAGPARFVFLKDEGGDENSQLYYYTGPGNIRPVTQGKFIHGFPLWSHDGKYVAYYGNDRDGASYDIYLADMESNAPPRLVFGGQEDTWYPLDWSPDDRK